MHKNVIKYGNGDVYQDMPDNLCDMLKDDKVALYNYGENGKIYLETNGEEDALDIVFIIQKMVDRKNILTIKVSFYYEEMMLKRMCVCVSQVDKP